MSNYSTAEMMVARAARELRNDEVVFVGIGLPNMACNLALRTHAPRLTMIYESGVIGAAPDRLPISIGDPCLVKGASAVCSITDVFQNYLVNGKIDVGFLGAAQMDRFGNINTTVIGDYEDPKVRLPGSGGACEMAIHARRVVLIATQTRQSFPETIDFVTSPGHFCNGKTREEWGMPGAGPAILITDLGVYTFTGDSGELVLIELHPGKSIDDIAGSLGWDVPRATELLETSAPTHEELRIMREDLDPHHLYI